jgi:hypothetical protein
MVVKESKGKSKKVAPPKANASQPSLKNLVPVPGKSGKPAK